MGLFDFFSTGITLASVEKFSRAIKSTQTFRHFSSDDSEMVSDYKNFEITMIASAMTFIALDMNIKNINHKKDIQTVYIGKSAPFLRKLKSKKCKVLGMEINEQKAKSMFKNDIEAMLCFETHVKFEIYLKDLKKSLQDNSPFYFLKFAEPQIDDFTGEEEYGETWLYDYLINVLLSEERPDYDDNESDSSTCVGFKPFVDLNDAETELLKTFVNDLILSLSN